MADVLKKGLIEQTKITQKSPREEVKGSLKPVNKKEGAKGKGKGFKIC